MSSREIFILEDELTMRAMLKVVLEQSGYQPVFFVDGDALQAEVRRSSPACVLLDVLVPGRSGLEILRALRSEDCPAPILMVSGHGNIAIAVQALQIGAADFIETPFAASDLVARIGRVAVRSSAAQASAALNFEGGQRLTRREREMLGHLLAGSTSKVIARQLGVSPRTVAEHRSNIMRKAGVKSVAQLMVAALEAARGSERTSPGSRRGTRTASHQAHFAHAANGQAASLATG